MSEIPVQRQKYINEDGTLTTSGYALFDDMVRRLDALEEASTAQAAADAAQDLILADHETRITALEP